MQTFWQQNCYKNEKDPHNLTFLTFFLLKTSENRVWSLYFLKNIFSSLKIYFLTNDNVFIPICPCNKLMSYFKIEFNDIQIVQIDMFHCI
jgi:hypothetical protein